MSAKKTVKNMKIMCSRCGKLVQKTLRNRDEYKDGLFNGKPVHCPSCRQVRTWELKTPEQREKIKQYRGTPCFEMDLKHKAEIEKNCACRSLSKKEIAEIASGITPPIPQKKTFYIDQFHRKKHFK